MAPQTWIPLMEWGARITLAVLVLLSFFSVALILERRKFLRRKTDPVSLTDLKTSLRKGQALPALTSESVIANYWALLSQELSDSPSDVIDRATRSFLSEERQKLEQGLTFLATIGSNAPFIGLFGTVLGIIQAFGELSAKQGSGSSSVMSSISEALIATAVGLLVAIPAVIAYNFFQRRVREILTPCEILRDEYLAFRRQKD
jgi:biopolymer transport protein ExbB